MNSGNFAKFLILRYEAYHISGLVAKNHGVFEGNDVDTGDGAAEGNSAIQKRPRPKQSPFRGMKKPKTSKEWVSTYFFVVLTHFKLSGAFSHDTNKGTGNLHRRVVSALDNLMNGTLTPGAIIKEVFLSSRG